MDRIFLETITDRIIKNDYFLIDDSLVENYNWDSFFKDDYVLLYNSFLLESFEKIRNLEKTNFGLWDQYRIVINNGMEFVLNINYNDADRTRNVGMISATAASFKNRTDIEDGYKNLLKMKEDEYTALSEFRDVEGRHNSTGEVGASAKEVFSMVISSMIDSFSNREIFDKTVGIMIYVENKESRRLELYKKIIERKLENHFPYIVVDTASKMDDGVTVLMAMKRL